MERIKQGLQEEGLLSRGLFLQTALPEGGVGRPLSRQGAPYFGLMEPGRPEFAKVNDCFPGALVASSGEGQVVQRTGTPGTHPAVPKGHWQSLSKHEVLRHGEERRDDYLPFLLLNLNVSFTCCRWVASV